jgi:RNA polymerase sigma-70 factor (ECF subfamily)
MTRAAAVTDDNDLRTTREQGVFEARALAYLTSVRRYAQSLTRNSSDADDLTQETFVRALQYWHRFAPEMNCRHWLFAICRNTHLRRWQRELRQQQVLERFHTWAAHETGGWSTGDRLTDADAAQVQEYLAHALETVPSCYRKVFELVDLDDRSYGDAATVLSVPIGTVRSRLYRARHLLRAALHDQRVRSA